MRETLNKCSPFDKNKYLCKIKRDLYKMELKTLIAECTAYDFKVMLEEKKLEASIQINDEPIDDHNIPYGIRPKDS
ncbi:MAG: hypothetical protein IJJ98_03820 [Prevotella sp.]|nr:hypothetical protein [Prevotella sp.]